MKPIILNVRINFLIKVVFDVHGKEISGLFWDEEKKMLLSASIDKSIKLNQFPMFWPGEMIRKSAKNHKNLIKTKNDEDKGKL